MTRTVVVRPVADPVLVVEGTEGNDFIFVTPKNGKLQVWVNGQLRGEFAGVTRLMALGKGGDDVVVLHASVTVPAILDGGDGDDALVAGGGPAVLLGGSGNDALFGGKKNDVLIGGTGSDLLIGGRGDDVLIAGTTDHDANTAALWAILGEWSRCDLSYTARVAALRDKGVGPNGAVKLNTQTVHDDGAEDVLLGGCGRDWFFANVAGPGRRDHVLDRRCGEGLDDLE